MLVQNVSGRPAWLSAGSPCSFFSLTAPASSFRYSPSSTERLQLGYPRDSVFILGVILLSCVVAYAVPRTSVLGALLLTGYLGGAVATHVRVQNPLFSHVLFPTYVSALLWGGLMLRDARLRALLPIRRAS